MGEGCSLARTVKGVSPPTAPGFFPDIYSKQAGGARGGETPSTGKGTAASSIDLTAIETDLSAILERAIKSGPELSGIEFHTRVQRNVSKAAERHGFSSVREYPVAYNAVDRSGKSLEVYGLIDVMWHQGPSLIAAIEIDSCHRHKSIKKLMASEALHKFWICYGELSVDDIWNIDDSINIINILHRPKKHRCKKR